MTYDEAATRYDNREPQDSRNANGHPCWCECMQCSADFAADRAHMETLLAEYRVHDLTPKDEAALLDLLEAFEDFPGLTEAERAVKAELRLSF